MREWLKDRRERKCLTQEQASELCGISRSYYTHIENDVKTPTVKVAKVIAEVLDFDWTSFFKEEGSLKEHFP
ncbi:XRE family transcriptional regulator [Brevibacillus choshinensis]|uniref:XRE family transcriptional regulator n=1 Tax=Brevibacillus choshinensis TaxID=54911 RepID=A0ABR5N079_BRECH|nr:helix-turn-helix transcriptional regulator [Brevibacillus choshinensis]KQL43914.1 XRE family transcriptional regulator [Brevibacillus choshinensis]